MLSVRSLVLKAAVVYTAACSSSPVDPTPGPGPGPAPVASITLSAQQLTLPPGQTLQVTATPRDAEGRPLSGRQVTWTSSNQAAVVITNGDRITAVAAGTAEVRATAEGKSAALTVTVVEVAPAVVALVTPTTEQLLTLGTAKFLDVVPVDAQGRQVPNVGITWRSTNEVVASVTATGAVMTHRPGVATIVATAAGLEVGIRVVALPAPSASPVVAYTLRTVEDETVGAIISSETVEQTENYTVVRIRRMMGATLTWDVEAGRYRRTYQVRSALWTTFAWGSMIESAASEETITDEGTVGHLFPMAGVVFTSAGTIWPPFQATIGTDGALTLRQPIPGGAGQKTLVYRPA